MKKIVLTLIIVLSLISNIYASEKFVITGLNVSQFYDTISKPLPGYSIGFGWEWKKGCSSALIFSPSFFSQKVKLENKTVRLESSEFFKMDIWCRISYLDLPFFYRHYFRDDSFYLSGGFSFNIGVYDGSETKNNRQISKIPRSDFKFNMDPGPFYILGSSTFDVLLNGGIRANRLAIGGLLRMSMGDIGTIKSIEIDSHIISFSILGSWYF